MLSRIAGEHDEEIKELEKVSVENLKRVRVNRGTSGTRIRGSLRITLKGFRKRKPYGILTRCRHKITMKNILPVLIVFLGLTLHAPGYHHCTMRSNGIVGKCFGYQYGQTYHPGHYLTWPRTS